MKCTVYAAMSVNAQIARKNGSVDFVSADEWRAYAAKAKGATVVVGRVTYRLMLKGGEFNKIKPSAVIVVSQKKKA